MNQVVRTRAAVRGVALAVGVLSLCGCGYSSLQQQDERVRTSWSEVVNQYQRRADLAASLATTVKGLAASEEAVAGAAERGASSASLPAAAAALNDPAAFSNYQAFQEQLTQALRNLVAVSETYPQLQGDANFRDLKTQLAETEDRLAVARGRYIAAVRAFNTSVRTFPTDLTARVFDFRARPDLTGDGTDTAPGATRAGSASRTTPAARSGSGASNGAVAAIR